MLDKSRLGVEDKALRPVEIRGPAATWCTKCRATAYHNSSAIIPPACPGCGTSVEVQKSRE